MNINELVSSKGRFFLGGPRWHAWANAKEVLLRDDPAKASAWKRERQEIEEAGQRFTQLMAGQINAYNKSLGGAAITIIEEPKLKQYANPDATFENWENFIGTESQVAAAQERDVLTQMPAPAAAIWLARTGQGSAPLVSQTIPGYKEGPTQAVGFSAKRK
jgi:hypothetical protein